MFPLMSFTDKEIINGIRKRDNKIVKHFIKEFFPIVRFIVKNNYGTQEDAKDIFQDVFATILILSEKKSFKLTSSLKTLVYSIARNRKLRRSRKRSGHP